MTSQSYSSVSLACQPGYDGGVEQVFLLQLLPAYTAARQPGQVTACPHCLINIRHGQEGGETVESPGLPQFTIENLASGAQFKAVVFARNEKGDSEGTEVGRLNQ